MLKKVISFFTALSLTLMLFGALNISALRGGHAHKACANLNHTGCSHSEIEYEPFPSGDDSLNIITSNKNFYLTENLNDDTLLYDIFIEGATVNLCLNGHNIITQKKQITAKNGTLNICDCGSGGYIKNTLYTEGVVGTDSWGTLNIYGGKFIGEKGGGIFTSEYSVTSDINIYGGEISSAEADCIWLRNGSTLSIYGGTIESTTDNKDGIYTFGDTTININGGNIIGKRYGIRLTQGNNTVNIDGGTITGKKYGILINYSNNIVNINGGNIIGTDNDAINVKAENTVNISGGKVLSEKGSYSISNYGTTNISGGIIGGGNNYNYILNCGSLSLQGSPTLTNAGIYLYDDNNITISGALTNTEAYPIYVQNSSLPRTFTNDWDTHMTDKNVSKYFKSPYNTVKIAYRNNEAVKVFYYKITYDANGGSCPLQTAEANASDKLTSLAEATRDGYIFAGWFTEADCGEHITTDTVFTNDTTIYAHWTCDHDFGTDYQRNDDQHWQVCTKCGAESEKTDHDWDEGKITTAATCTEKGEKTYTCSDCKATKTEEINVAGHEYAEGWKSDNNEHWHECTVCGNKKDNASHAWGEGTVTTPPTETSEGVKTFTCSDCAAKKTESIDKLTHTHTLTAHEAVPATCTTDGNKAYWTCSGCNKMFSDENGTTEIDSIPVISAAGHKYEWESDDNEHWHECTVCHNKKDTAEHTWDDGEITISPSEEAEGVRTYKCIVCEATKTEKIDRLPPTDTSVSETEPPVTDSSETESSGTEPPVTEPSDTGSSGTEPPVIEPSDTEPTVTAPPVTEPPITEPTVTAPPVTEPVVTDPTYVPYFPPNSTSAPAVPVQREPFLQDENGKIGWDVISDEIGETLDGETVRVNMNGTTKLPKNIVSDIAGRDIDLVLIMNRSFTWTINGMSVTKARDVDMTVKKTSKIPKSAVRKFFGDLDTVQLDLRYNGDFGFIAELDFNIGNRYSGMYANSYCYKSRKFEFGDSSEIVNGQARLRFSHASSWLITIENSPVLEDVSSAAGAHSDGVPIDMSNSASGGITIPEFDEKRGLKLSNRKRRYRILKKRKFDNLVFVL